MWHGQRQPLLQHLSCPSRKGGAGRTCRPWARAAFLHSQGQDLAHLCAPVFSFQRELLEKGYGTATQFPLDRKQQFSPTNCRFFLENNPRNGSVKGTAQNRLLFQLATAECTCVGLFLSSSYKNNFHHFKSFFQVAQAGFIFQH